MTPPNDESLVDDVGSYRPGPITVLLIMLLVLAMLTTLVWPLLRTGSRHYPTPTPTPLFLQAA